METPTRPLLVFDGDCGFCRSWIARWERSIGGAVDFAPSQEVAAAHPEIPPQRFTRSVVLIEPSGEASFGAEAVFRALARGRRGGAPLWAYRNVRGFAALSELVYRTIASHRGMAATLTRWLWGAHVVPPGERLTAWVFVRAVGAVFLIAFASLGVQIAGLAGSDGILPAREFLDRVASGSGAERFLFVPSLVWLHPSDELLVLLCAAGGAGSLLLIAGAAPGPLLLALWALYLSLASVGGEFLWFQWDGLLLETAIVAALVAPWRWWSRPTDPVAPPRAAWWLARWLLFRLVLSSAIVKLTSGDPSWRNLTALSFHYETQPLPPWTAWYAHQLPEWFQKLSAIAMFGIEGLLPFFFCAPRRLRLVAAGGTAFLQALIVITGNYGFFNWLTLVLCIVLLDDAVWPAWLRRWARARETSGDRPASEPVAELPSIRSPSHSRPRRRAAGRVIVGVAAVLFVLGLCPVLLSLGVPGSWLGPLLPVWRVSAPFRTVNSYGLFAVMTTERPEIVIEGSADGVTWLPYAFRWKVGDPQRRPPFVVGHMPRLDWQMWFAALVPERVEPWFLSFSRRLLEGSEPVRRLLDADPFPGTPPRFLRATVYRYRFADPATRRSTGAWWTRERGEPYIPPLTLDGGRLVLARPSGSGRGDP